MNFKKRGLAIGTAKYGTRANGILRHLNASEKCFACDKPLVGTTNTVVTEDGAQHVYVGPDCFRKIKAAGTSGYQPQGGGPKLFTESSL